MLKIYYKICCGIDVHKKILIATIATTDNENITTYETKRFSTMTNELNNLKKWLQEGNCKDVCMESTGKYWIPIFNILESSCKISIVHPKYVRAILGKKTDIKDSIWIADVFKHGLVQSSFIPTKEIRQLRELLRYRTKLTYCKTSEKNRFQNSLITSNIMISNIISDTFGKTSLSIIDLALSKDKISEEDIKPLICRNVKATTEEILASIDGIIDPSENIKIKLCLEHYNNIISVIDKLDTQILKLALTFEKEIKLICTVPGINLLSAVHILAEIGNDMNQFKSSRFLCSWSGLVPQNNESAGKKKSVRISHGGHYIKPILIQCALATIRSKECDYFKHKYEILKKRRGHKKAIIAIARMLLTCIFNILTKSVPFDNSIYTQLDNKHFNNADNVNIKTEASTNKIDEAVAVNLLLSLGYTITASNKQL